MTRGKRIGRQAGTGERSCYRLDIKWDEMDAVTRREALAYLECGAHAGQVLDDKPALEDLAAVVRWFDWHDLAVPAAPPAGWERRAPAAPPAAPAKRVRKAPPAAPEAAPAPQTVAPAAPPAPAKRQPRTIAKAAPQWAADAPRAQQWSIAWLLGLAGVSRPGIARALGMATGEDLEHLLRWQDKGPLPCVPRGLEVGGAPAAPPADPITRKQAVRLSMMADQARAALDALERRAALDAQKPVVVCKWGRPVLERYEGIAAMLPGAQPRLLLALALLLATQAPLEQVAGWLELDAASVDELARRWHLTGTKPGGPFWRLDLWLVLVALELAPSHQAKRLAELLCLDTKAISIRLVTLESWCQEASRDASAG